MAVVRPLSEVVEEQVDRGRVPGVVALVATGDDAEVAVAGRRSIDGPPMARDAIFRLASATKPIVAAAALALVDQGRVALDDPVAPWLPELAEPRVLRSPSAALDDVVPAIRPITLDHLLSFRAGHGFSPDGGEAVTERLLEDLHQGRPSARGRLDPDVWMARLGALPLAHQPGEGWTYNTGSDVLGVLLSRVVGAPFEQVLRDTVLDPVGMPDTGFTVPAASLSRATAAHERTDDGGLRETDPADGRFLTPPVFASGAGGLVSTADDWAAFGRMLLRGGVAGDGTRVLAEATVRAMTSIHVTSTPTDPFLLGSGWGYGGSVDVEDEMPWTVPGRYGWLGSAGTAGHVIPDRDVTSVVLTQVEMAGPDDFSALGDLLTWVAEATAP